MRMRQIIVTLCLGVFAMTNSIPESAHAHWVVPPSAEILENTPGLIHAVERGDHDCRLDLFPTRTLSC